MEHRVWRVAFSDFNAMKLLLAFLCSATAFPAMLFERLTPNKPPPMTVVFNPKKSRYHHYKNIWVESLRSDEQWWGKFLAFTIVALAVLAVLI